MPPIPFNVRNQARFYAATHYRSDAGVQDVFYLPTGASEKEIRLVEVNNLMVEMRDDCLEPFELVADHGMNTEHHLFILDVTPAQWTRINAREIKLPEGWTLEEAERFKKPALA